MSAFDETNIVGTELSNRFPNIVLEAINVRGPGVSESLC